MTFLDATIFLELVKSRNISKTAEKLFLAQSTISAHLKQMEAELGAPLFERSKGHRRLELTAMAKELIPVAEHISLAEKQLKLLKTDNIQMLSLASNESFFYEILQPFLTLFRRKHPDIHLSVQVKDTAEVYQLLQKDFVDLGFGSFSADHAGMMASPLYKQKWVIVSGKTLRSENGWLDIKELDPSLEIFYSAGDLSSIYQWRQKELGTQYAGQVEFNSFLESLDMLRGMGAWEFGTSIWSSRFQSVGGYEIYQLKNPPAGRLIYLLSRERKEMREAERLFREELRAYLEEQNIGVSDN